MEALVQRYMGQPAGMELEARFGTDLTLVSYKRIGQRLLARGFVQKGVPQKILRVALSDGLRLTLSGQHAIQAYLGDDRLPPAARFERKKLVKSEDSDYGFRLALSEESPVDEAEEGRLRQRWASLSKTHRLIETLAFEHADFPQWVVECSTVKACYQRVHRASECSLHLAVPTYEVEVEAVDAGEGMGAQFKQIATLVLGGVQNTRYPVTKSRMELAAEHYRRLCGIDPSVAAEARFAGPNPVTLQLEHLYPQEGGGDNADEAGDDEEELAAEKKVVATVLQGYSVTDKADGQRKLLFVDDEGDVFFVTSRMAFEFANVRCPAFARTLLDGEAVEAIGMFAAFDAYFVKGEDVRARPLLGAPASRYEHLCATVRGLEAHVPNVVPKVFYTGADIREACRRCLQTPREYETDGLVFTPINCGVGANAAGHLPPNRGAYTWARCLKWKPREKTTFDFKIAPTADPAVDDRQMVHFCVVCRSNGAWDRPQVALLEQTTAQPRSAPGVRPFVTDEDPYSHVGYVAVRDGNMVTAAGEVVPPGAIVECAYDPAGADMWRWTPVRVRWDKKTPNAFETAHNNWQYQLCPVAETDLTEAPGRKEVPRYYKGDKTSMLALRRFHGYVKHALLSRAVALLRDEQGAAALNLCDFGTGKAGDLSKWRRLNLAFVLGVDLCADNIRNQQDGACVRYLKTANRTNRLRALFAVGDMCSDLWDNSEGSNAGDLDRLILLGAFGRIARPGVEAYPNLAAHYNTRFQLTSAMFCLHYAFKSKEALDHFVHNVARATALGGYFVGCAWDGHRIFHLLRDVPKGGQVQSGDFVLTKRYAGKAFEGEPVAVGYGIEVSQKTFHPAVEYLVDLPGLEVLLRARGFKTVAVRGFDTYYGGYTDDKQPALAPAERELSFANQTFCFQKIEG